MIKTKLTIWFSDKWNLIGIYALCSICMGVILYGRLTFNELALIYILMGVCSLVVFVLGISRGMVIAYLEKDTIDNILKKIIKKSDDDDETL